MYYNYNTNLVKPVNSAERTNLLPPRPTGPNDYLPPTGSCHVIAENGGNIRSILGKTGHRKIKRHRTGGKQANKGVINLNIGGSPYIFMTSQLSHPSSSLLAKFVSERHEDRLYRADAYLEESKQYYWARSPHLFQPIADFYFSKKASGGSGNRHIHLTANICHQAFLAELQFWGLPRSFIGSCCEFTKNIQEMEKFEYHKLPRNHSAPNGFKYAHAEKEEEEEEEEELPNTIIKKSMPYLSFLSLNTGIKRSFSSLNQNGNIEDLDVKSSCYTLTVDGTEADSSHAEKGYKAYIWRLTEEPASSLLAKIWAFTSMFFVVASVSTLVFGSMKYFKGESGDPIFVFKLVEWICIAWFSFELVTRFCACPNRIRFFCAFLNIVDFLSILPFFFELIVELMGAENSGKLDKIQALIFMLRILKVLRVSRIFKLARYSTGMQTFGNVIKASLSELGISLIALVTAMIVFSTIMYFIEKDADGSPFQSIPDACYWSVITMTTVGYGDSIPVTVAGKILASITSICGVLVLAFPVTTIVGNFHKYTQKQEEADRVALEQKWNYQEDQ